MRKLINNYGTRKNKVELEKRDIIVSRRRIGRIMAKNGLVSNYTVKQFKVQQSTVNEDEIKNELNHEFDKRRFREVVINVCDSAVSC